MGEIGATSRRSERWKGPSNLSIGGLFLHSISATKTNHHPPPPHSDTNNKYEKVVLRILLGEICYCYCGVGPDDLY